MNLELVQYIESSILPMYDGFDAAHRRDHVEMVIKQSLDIAGRLDVNEDMVYAIAAYHDTGLVKDRKTHHIVSSRIVRNDLNLKQWFSEDEIETMALAVEDHRASSNHEPRSIYGKIVAEADRFIDPVQIITRTVQYGLQHYPELDKEGHFRRTVEHLHEKYADGGYLKLWFEDSPNVTRLETLRAIIRDYDAQCVNREQNRDFNEAVVVDKADDESQLRKHFNSIYDSLIANYGKI